MNRRIGEIAILVRDYDEAIAWFTQRLGFSLRANDPLRNGERWVTVGPGSGEASVRLARAENAVQAAQVGRQAVGRVLCYLHTDNFARDYEAFLAKGIHFTELPRDELYGTVAVFEDLYGNWWDLIQRNNAVDNAFRTSSKPSAETPEPVLLAIDLQNAIHDPKWGRRNNPDAEQKVAALLAQWRSKGWPIFHIRHDSTDTASPYRPGQPGNEFISDLAPINREPVIAKQTNSAFVGTDLRERLDAEGYRTLVIVGVITNNSVEATVRTAGNLGFEVFLVEDACFTFGKPDWRGFFRDAEDVHAMSLANLDREYCAVVSAAHLMNRLG